MVNGSARGVTSHCRLSGTTSPVVQVQSEHNQTQRKERPIKCSLGVPVWVWASAPSSSSKYWPIWKAGVVVPTAPDGTETFAATTRWRGRRPSACCESPSQSTTLGALSGQSIILNTQRQRNGLYDEQKGKQGMLAGISFPAYVLPAAPQRYCSFCFPLRSMAWTIHWLILISRTVLFSCFFTLGDESQSDLSMLRTTRQTDPLEIDVKT